MKNKFIAYLHTFVIVFYLITLGLFFFFMQIQPLHVVNLIPIVYGAIIQIDSR